MIKNLFLFFYSIIIYKYFIYRIKNKDYYNQFNQMTDFIKNGQNPKKNTNKEYDQFDDLNIHGQLSPDSYTLKKMLGFNNSKF